jgi:hypothetical protein
VLVKVTALSKHTVAHQVFDELEISHEINDCREANDACAVCVSWLCFRCYSGQRWRIQHRDENQDWYRRALSKLFSDLRRRTKGFLARRGFDVEMIQMAPNLTAMIGKWMALNLMQAVKAYDSVKDTHSRDGVPTPEQSKAYIAMLAATAGLNADLPPATIFDFSLSTAAAKELAGKRF